MRWMNDHMPIWVDVQGMDDKTMNELAEIFGLHPLTLEDCTVADTREKIEN
jgi:Mg2+ and Co2+ transporter CorA